MPSNTLPAKMPSTIAASAEQKEVEEDIGQTNWTDDPTEQTKLDRMSLFWNEAVRLPLVCRPFIEISSVQFEFTVRSYIMVMLGITGVNRRGFLRPQRLHVTLGIVDYVFEDQFKNNLLLALNHAMMCWTSDQQVLVHLASYGKSWHFGLENDPAFVEMLTFLQQILRTLVNKSRLYIITREFHVSWL